MKNYVDLLKKIQEEMYLSVKKEDTDLYKKCLELEKQGLVKVQRFEEKNDIIVTLTDGGRCFLSRD